MKREYWKYMKTIVPYLRRHKLLASASMLLMVAGALAALAQPWPLAFVVDDVLGRQHVPQAGVRIVMRKPARFARTLGTDFVHSVVVALFSVVTCSAQDRVTIDAMVAAEIAVNAQTTRTPVRFKLVLRRDCIFLKPCPARSR